jgi:hypothetical protein
VKEGFSPKIVEQAIQTDGVEPGSILLDPFSGSGTAPLTGALEGLQPRAFEVNPFLHFLSSTKMVNASGAQLELASSAVLQALRKSVVSPLEGFSTFTTGNRWNRWLFPVSILRSYESGKRVIMKANAKYRSLLKLALIGATMDCCNATRDGKCVRYAKDWIENQATPTKLRDQFEIRIKQIIDDLADAPLLDDAATVIQGDSRHLLGTMKEKFRLCVTSPPYLNSFDYSDVYRPELFLGGFVRSTKALMNVRLKTLRSHVQARWKNPERNEFGILYQKCLSEIKERESDLWDKRLPTMVQAYFEDMDTVLRSLRARARTDGSVWLVVSTSAYAGVEVPVDLILAEIAQKTGWFLREVGVLRYLRSSSQHVRHVEEVERKSVPLRESVVILDASAKGHKPMAASTSPSTH